MKKKPVVKKVAKKTPAKKAPSKLVKAVAKKALPIKVVDLNKYKPAERRVMIAQDVIAGLNTKRLEAATSMWVNDKKGVISHMADEAAEIHDNDSYAKFPYPEQFHEVLSKVKHCQVCALGGVFVSAVERFNDVQSRNITELDFDTITTELSVHFDEEMLAKIEYAFEGGDGGISTYQLEDNYLVGADEINLLKLYSKAYPDAKERMIVLMENIIRNKGDFVPQVF